MLRTNQDKIILKPDKPIDKIGSIYIPEAYQSTLWSGTVIAVGPGDLDAKGRFTPTTLKPGARVLVDTARAVQLSYDGEEYMVTREKEILGTITEEGDVLTWNNQGRLTRREWEDTMKTTQQGKARRVTASGQ